jgi:hypothetical protein
MSRKLALSIRQVVMSPILKCIHTAQRAGWLTDQSMDENTVAHPADDQARK